jgi:hypothetical protein
VPTQKLAREAVADGDAYRAESIYKELSTQPLTPKQIEDFIGRLDAKQQMIAARLLRDGVNYQSYATMMDQSRQLHTRILETVPGNDPRNMLILTGLEENSSANLVNNLYARTNGLTADNFISVKDLNLVKRYLTNEQYLRHGAPPSPEVKAVMDKLKGKQLVYMDDIANSGKQIPKLLNIQEDILFRHLVDRNGERLVKEVTVGTLGRHQLPEHVANPWTDQPTYPGLHLDAANSPGPLRVRVVDSPATYHDVTTRESFDRLFPTPPQGFDLPTYNDLLNQIGAGSSMWSGSPIRTAVVTPYGGANNNIPLVQAIVEMPGGMNLPRRFPGVDWWKLLNPGR